MRGYLRHLLGFSIFLIVALAGFNWLMDPYKIWNAPQIRGVNAAKPQIAVNERIFKIVGLAKQPAEVVILGTSRSEIGLNPTHAALGPNGLNLAIGLQPYRETRMLIDWLRKNHEPVKTFVIGLDFFVANAFLPYPVDFDVENFSAERSWQLLTSVSSVVDATQTIGKNNPLPSNTWSENGRRLWSGYDVKVKGGHKKIMKTSENWYLRYLYSPEPECTFDFVSADSKLSPLAEIRTLLARAYREHTDIKLFISPSHARQWEALAALGLWNKWEEWKQRLVKMNEEEAQRAGRQPFPLWDFSGYNSISTEAVPALGDTTTMMRWYFDSSHYNTAAGDLVLDRIFDFKTPRRSVPDDFGIRLSSANIEGHLARIRTDRAAYKRTHPEDIAEIAAMAHHAVQTLQCKNPIIVQ